MENTNNNILEIKNLHTYFYTDSGVIKSVDGVDIELREGTTLGIVGESGSGKSVTALSVMGLLMGTTGKVAEGEILFEGRDLTKLDDEERRKMRGEKISMIFQEPMTSLNPVMKIGDQITECILMHNNISKQEAWDKAVEMLKLTGVPRVERMMKEYPFQLSGGQRQRVMIAMALVCKPKILIADEPTTALDVTIQAQVLNLLHQLQKEFNLTYIFVAHDLSVVEHISDRVGVMYLGNFVEVGDKRKLYSNPLHPYTQALLSAVPVPDPTAKKDRIILEGSIPSALNPPSGCKFHTRCPRCMDICKQKAPERYQVSDDHYVYCHLYDDKIKENKG